MRAPFFSGSEKPQKEVEQKKPTGIKEVKPATAPTNALPEKPKKVVEYRKLEDGKIMKYVNGWKAWMYPREDYHGPIHTTRVAYVETIEDKTFKHAADREIASLLLIEPGDIVMGGPDYQRTFVRDFLKTYENPFIPEPGDTPEQKELKLAVAEVKGELKARYEAGEDIAKVMQDAREQLRQLSVYKYELQQEVNKYARTDALSAEDVEDFVKAANKMLEDRGVKPMAMNGFLKHQCKVLKKRAEAQKEQK